MLQKMKFGVQAIVSGQKSSTVNAEPQLIVNSTSGKFTLTAPVTKALGIADGEYVQFFNNRADIESAISEGREDVKAYFEENGLDINDPATVAAFVDEMTTFYVAKGIALFDGPGNPTMVSARWTKDDKASYFAEHGAEHVAECVAEYRKALDMPEATEEEIYDAIAADPSLMLSPSVQKYAGSKSSTTSSQHGVGLQLGFTDASTWALLKKGCDDPTKTNRYYKALITESEVVKQNNGYEEVDVRIVPLEFDRDEACMVRGGNQ